MINSEIFREIQNLEAKADEIISSTNEEIIKLKEEAKDKISFEKANLEEKLNSYLEEKKRELFLYYLTKETLTREETQELIDLTFSDQKESERANFLWAKVERK